MNDPKTQSPMKMSRTLCLAVVSTLFLLTPLLAQQQSEENTLHIPPRLTVEVVGTQETLFSILKGRERRDLYSSSKTIIVERNDGERTTNLLPMIFFDIGSTTVPERYQRFTKTTEANDYKESNAVIYGQFDNVEHTNLKYLEILNIIGYRMRQYSNATIRLEGGYSIEPGESAELAVERAEIVSEYLQNIWHISSERIRILPPRQMTDSSDNILRQEEARRVIIHTDDWPLIRPVRYTLSNFNTTFAVFSISLNPWVDRDDLTRITLLIASGDELLSATQLPIDRDSVTYNYIGLWMLPRSHDKLESSIHIEALIETTSGKLRTSNNVTIAIDVEKPEIIVEGDFDDSFEEDPYENEILFFESGDTTLGVLQQMILENSVEWLQRKREEYNAPVELSMSSNTELSENPLADFTKIQAEYSLRQSRPHIFSSFFKDPSFQIPLYIISPSMLPPTGGGKGSMQGTQDDLMRVWFGDRFDELIENVEIARSHIDASNEEVEATAAIIISRLTSVATWFAERIDTSQIPLSPDSYLEPVSSYELESYYDKPEDRFYARSIYLYVTPQSDEYEIDDLEYEETEVKAAAEKNAE